MTDLLQRFDFDGTDVRGEIAQLHMSYRDILSRHHYPTPVRHGLGQLLAATALLSANLKFAGRLTLQLRLEGAVRLLQAETNEQGQLRAIARYDDVLDEQQLNLSSGSMVITMEPEQGQRYQGITAIEGGDIAKALEGYFANSEQLPTRFWLFANDQQAAGFMIQKVPAAAGTEVDVDAWERITYLSSTLKAEEVFNLPAEEILHRLFHEEQTRIYPASALSFYCTCSKERLAGALTQLGYDELDSMLKELGSIDINCEFCQQHYRFNRDEVEGLFPQRHLH